MLTNPGMGNCPLLRRSIASHDCTVAGRRRVFFWNCSYVRYCFFYNVS